MLQRKVNEELDLPDQFTEGRLEGPGIKDRRDTRPSSVAERQEQRARHLSARSWDAGARAAERSEEGPPRCASVRLSPAGDAGRMWTG